VKRERKHYIYASRRIVWVEKSGAKLINECVVISMRSRSVDTEEEADLVAERRSIHVAFLPVKDPERLSVVHEVRRAEVTVHSTHGRALGELVLQLVGERFISR